MAEVSVGDVFGKWTVISLDAPRYKGHIQVQVQCECGAQRCIPRSSLTRTERPSRQCKDCARKQAASQRFGTRRASY